MELEGGAPVLNAVTSVAFSTGSLHLVGVASAGVVKVVLGTRVSACSVTLACDELTEGAVG